MMDTILLIIISSPLVSMIILGGIHFAKIRFLETYLSEFAKYFSLAMSSLSFYLFIETLIQSPAFLLIDYADWFKIGEYEFNLRFIIDRYAAAYALLTTTLIGIIFKYSRNYLHREKGYFRFIFLLLTLMFGLLIVSFSRALDLLFVGWELVGTASVLLIGYFYDRSQPVIHAKKALISYRLCDMGILAAAAWAHHYLHTTDFIFLPLSLKHHHEVLGSLFVGLFIIWASLAKAGQLPMSSWLPAAMEGPTPSSAIFYGALSVHLGPFLLIRFYSYLAHFPILLIVIGLIGILSAIYATLVGRTRCDAKTLLAYATISQVGLIYLEISLGFLDFALFHIFTHASIRTYQFLRSGSLIQDFVDNPIVEANQTIKRRYFFEKLFSSERRRRFYIHALNGFYLDYFNIKIINLLLKPIRWYISFEERWRELDTRILRKLLRRD